MESGSKKSEGSAPEPRTRRRRPDERELLAAIVELVDDGFATRSALAARLPRFSRRDLTKAYERLATRGLVLERRGPDGATYLALTSEGWRALEAAEGRTWGRPGR